MISRNVAKAQELARQHGTGATTGNYGAAPAGDIVILAVPYLNGATVVADFGEALDGKVIIDISNPVASELLGLVTPHGGSGAQETAKGLPAGAHVVKAFNTIFGHVLARDGRLDAFIAGDDAMPRWRSAPFLKVSGCVSSMSAAYRWRRRSKPLA